LKRDHESQSDDNLEGSNVQELNFAQKERIVNQNILTLLESVVHVQQREVVAVNVRKPHLGLVRGLLRLRRADKALGNYGSRGRGARHAQQGGRGEEKNGKKKKSRVDA
jgi:hypothetical protein